MRILPVRRDLDPALGAVLAFLDDREGERLAGRLRGDAGAEDEFVVEGVGQLAAAPDDLLDALGDRLAVQVVALGVGAASVVSVQPAFGIGRTSMIVSGIWMRTVFVASPLQPCGTRRTPL